MDYNAYADELRKKISGYSESAEELEKNYKQALEQSRREYESTSADLDSARYAERNEAAAEALKQKQSNDQIFASRGLSNSGESERAAMLGKNALDTEDGVIEKRYTNAMQQADNKRKNADKSAYETLKKGKSEISKQIIEAKQKLETAEQSAYEQRNEAAYEHAAKEEAAHDGKNGKYAGGDVLSGTSKQDLLTEKEMAKNIISACCDGKSVKTETETAYIRVMLENLKYEFGFDDDYKADLSRLLASYGYVDMSLPEAEGRAAAATAADNFDRWVSEYYRSIRNSTQQPNLTAYEVARNKAKQLQKEYIYTHCTSTEAAELALKQLGYNYYDIRDFIKEANQSDGYTLGMNVNYNK